MFNCFREREFLFGLSFNIHLRESLLFCCADGSFNVFGSEVVVMVVPVHRISREAKMESF